MRYILTLLFLLTFANIGYAGDIFTISDINITGDGPTAVKAKNDALAKAEREAFNRLLERITPSFTKHLWPQLEDDQISELIQGFDIKEEKLTAKHYNAKLNITFNDLFVEKMLDESGVSYITKRTDPILLIPIAETSKDSARWNNAWKNSIDSSSFANINIASDRDVMNANIPDVVKDDNEIDSLGREKINNLLSKYNTGKLLYAKVTSSEYNGTIGVYVELSYLNEEYPDKVTHRFYGKAGQDSVEGIMKQATADVIGKIESKWKAEQETSQQAKAEISVNVPIRNLNQWSILSEQLKNLDFINQVDTKYVTVDYAAVNLHYQDSYGNFVRRLAANDFYIQKTENGLLLYQFDSPPSWFSLQYEEVGHEF